MIKTAPRISEKAGDFYPAHFSSRNGGLEYVLDAFPALYQRTIPQVLAKFKGQELMLIIDVFNATMLTAGIAGQHVGISVADGIDLDRLDEKWGIDRAEIMEKIEGLAAFEAACLEIWANGFWYAAVKPVDNIGIEEYITRYVGGSDGQPWPEDQLPKGENNP
jgi:hypothetical protein